MIQDYQPKAEDYFKNARKEISPLLPDSVERVFEIGCGSGGTLQWLKDTGRCKETYGVELFEGAAQAAKQHANAIVVGDAERLIDQVFDGMQFDLILCLDVLEHMVDPWAFVKKLHRLLAPEGRVIFSIPNVRNIKVLLPLALFGRWQYETEGILDRTHLRFFTRRSALELATTSELRVVQWLRNVPSKASKLGLLNVLTLGIFSDMLAVQYLISSARPAASAGSSESLSQTR